MFVRKLLDFCFTKRELSWLDDLMPESKKKKEDDKKKKAKEVIIEMALLYFLFTCIYHQCDVWVYFSYLEYFYSSTILLDFFNKLLSRQILSTQEARRLLEAGAGIEIPYEGSAHLEIPVKTLKVRLVTVHKSHT